MQGVAITWILIQIKQLYILKKKSVETLEEIWTQAGHGILEDTESMLLVVSRVIIRVEIMCF